VKIRLAIADDHPVVRQGLKYLVSQNRDMALVGEADDSRSTLEVCRTTAVDVLLLDVSMPGMPVVDLIRALRSESRSPRILVLSIHPERHYARRVLKAGADGYLTKNHSPTALADAIRQVHSGQKYVTPTLAQELAANLSEVTALVPHEALSDREYEVFRRLGAGARVDDIAQELALSPKTVRTYRSRILEKMNIRSTAELIFYAVQNGLVEQVAAESLPGDPAPAQEPARRGRKEQGSRTLEDKGVMGQPPRRS
jgi:DNA-binding NarL/FixJ family response regulator